MAQKRQKQVRKYWRPGFCGFCYFTGPSRWPWEVTQDDQWQDATASNLQKRELRLRDIKWLAWDISARKCGSPGPTLLTASVVLLPTTASWMAHLAVKTALRKTMVMQEAQVRAPGLPGPGVQICAGPHSPRAHQSWASACTHEAGELVPLNTFHFSNMIKGCTNHTMPKQRRKKKKNVGS